MTIPSPLSPEDLAFWYADQPRQRTTMALLLLLDHRPDPDQLRAAVARAVDAVPRLRQRVADAPFDLALPRWEDDPTFDLDFHVRRYALADGSPEEDELARLFRTLGPIYERPFERTRPLWELIEIDHPGSASAIFFKLHHAVADGVGGQHDPRVSHGRHARGEDASPSSRKGAGRLARSGPSGPARECTGPAPRRGRRTRRGGGRRAAPRRSTPFGVGSGG